MPSMLVQTASYSSIVTLGSKHLCFGCIAWDRLTAHFIWTAKSNPDPFLSPPFNTVACCQETSDQPLLASAHKPRVHCLQLLTKFFLSVAKAALQPTDEPDKVTRVLQTASLLLCASA